MNEGSAFRLAASRLFVNEVLDSHLIQYLPELNACLMLLQSYILSINQASPPNFTEFSFNLMLELFNFRLKLRGHADRQSFI